MKKCNTFTCTYKCYISADLAAVDKFNANAWDYAKNRQLHYCQLIIMSHQRQRLQSNPTSPVLNGLGLSLVTSNGFMNNIPNMNGSRSVNDEIDFDHMIVSAQILLSL